MDRDDSVHHAYGGTGRAASPRLGRQMSFLRDGNVPKVLTQEQVERYREEGYLSPIPVLSDNEVRHYRSSYEELEAALGGRPKATDLSLTHMHLPWSWDLIHHPRVLDAVEDILGPDIVCWASSIFPKQPHDPGFISFHQDGTYWGLNSMDVTTSWVALTESTPKNGCMRVVPGSHKEPVHPHKETWAEDNLLSRGQEIQVEVKEEGVTDLVLNPGEMSLHHVNIIHGSNANHSDGKRIGFAPRYIRPCVEQVQIAHRQPAVLVRGRDDHGHYDLIDTRPEVGPLDAIVEHHLTAARRHLEELTRTKAATGVSR